MIHTRLSQRRKRDVFCRVEIALFFLPFLMMVSCTSFPTPEDSLAMEKLIDEQLKSKDDVQSIFLGFKFGMSPDRVKVHTISEVLKENIDPAMETYQFGDNELIGELKWNVHSRFHNDSLLKLSLRCWDFMNENVKVHSFAAYSELIRLYTLKYGDPQYKSKNTTHWFVKNLEIKIERIKPRAKIPDLSIEYINTRRTRAIDHTRSKRDEDFNTFDPWYYDQRQVEEQPKEQPNTDI